MDGGLKAQAREFAAQTSELLNGTLTTGIRISPVVMQDGSALMGCGVTKTNPDPRPIPLGRTNQRVWLYLLHSYGPDPEGEYLAMTRSTLSLYTSEYMESEQLIVGIDYIREPANKYPGCHLHVHGDRDDLDRIYLGDARDSRKLRDLHLPVGGKRFRPTLEDLIEFVITEEMAIPDNGWPKVLAEHRRRWEDLQLKAAVRRQPEVAADALKKKGWTVSPPTSADL